MAATPVPLAAYITTSFETPIILATLPAIAETAPTLTRIVATYIATIPVTPNLTTCLRVLVLKAAPPLDLRLDLRLLLDRDREIGLAILYTSIEKK